MASSSASFTALAFFLSIIALLYNPVAFRLKLFGVGRWLGGELKNNVHGYDLKVLGDTYGTEDLHYYEPKNILFGIAEKAGTRKQWFPPADQMDTSAELGQAHFFMIAPEADQITRLELSNFKGPFVSHGFDILADPNDEESLYFFAVNHLINPAYLILKDSADVPKARSQIEVFRHTVGTLEVRHQRSIVDPLIRTPNDIFAVDDKTFYVTNDHWYREGAGRLLAYAGHEDFGAWSDIIHVSISDPASKDAMAGFTASVALENINNPNGLGHGRSHEEIFLGRAGSGIIHSMKPNAIDPRRLNYSDTEGGRTASTIQLPTTVDNPSYFHDPFAKSTGRDASGLVAAGLSFAIGFPDVEPHPSAVWLVESPRPNNQRGGKLLAPLSEFQPPRLLFHDDGEVMNTAATGVLVAIPPESNGGKKQAYLFIAGPLADGVVKTKVDL